MSKQPQKLEEAKALAKRSIARWRAAILGAHFENASKWAEAAGIDPATIRRNMDEGFASTTKVENLHLLARAANLPSVIDFLDSQSDDPAAAKLVPSADELAEMIQDAMDELPIGVSYADYPNAVSSGLRDRLVQYQAAGGSAGNAVAATALGKAVRPQSATMQDAAEE